MGMQTITAQVYYAAATLTHARLLMLLPYFSFHISFLFSLLFLVIYVCNVENCSVVSGVFSHENIRER